MCTIRLTAAQAGRDAVDWEEELNLGSPGVTGSDAANQALAEADPILGIGTRFQDFTTGSWTVFFNPAQKLVSINVIGHDAVKHSAVSLVADAGVAIEGLTRSRPRSSVQIEGLMA